MDGKGAEGREASDEELMRAYALGDESAFQNLYSRSAEKLYRFLWVRLGAAQGHLAEELFQRTWLKIHQARRSYDPSKKFSTWLFTIALNSLRDAVGAAHEKLPHGEFQEELAQHSEPSGEEACIRRDLIAQIHAFLFTLPESQRTAILLSDEEGLSSQEISEIMQVSDGAVRQLIRRARQAVRGRFTEEKS